jgi:hypothetical protein
MVASFKDLTEKASTNWLDWTQFYAAIQADLEKEKAARVAAED